MTKLQLKEILKLYAEIHDSIKIGEKKVVVKRYRKVLNVDLPSWTEGVKRGIDELMKRESGMIREIVELSYIKGYKDREVIMRLPVSDSGFYRMKKYIEEKLYELCIVYGYVTEEDILRNLI